MLSGGNPGPHKIQGIGAGFVPDVPDTSLFDEIIAVTNEDASEFGRTLALSEGISAGISSGAALCAAVRIAQRRKMKGRLSSQYFRTPEKDI